MKYEEEESKKKSQRRRGSLKDLMVGKEDVVFRKGGERCWYCIICFCSSAVLVLCVTIKQKKELKI